MWLLWQVRQEKEVSTGAPGRRLRVLARLVKAVGWDDYTPDKKPKKRYRAYKHGFGRSRYALSEKAGQSKA